MSKKDGKLHVVLQRKKHYILVPMNRAMALQAYLRSQSIVSWPPVIYDTITDSIELDSRSNFKTVQALLDQWS